MVPLSYPPQTLWWVYCFHVVHPSVPPSMAFYIGFYAYAIIVHTRADQLLPQLLMEQFDTLPVQCRHIKHMHEGVWFRNFFFDKMTAVRT